MRPSIQKSFIFLLNLICFKIQNKYVSGIACVVADCKVTKRSHPNIKLYNFPKSTNTNLFRNWVQICGVPDSRLHKKLMICEKPFRSEVQGKSRLKKNAIPELNLPMNSVKLGVEPFTSHDSHSNEPCSSQKIQHMEVECNELENIQNENKNVEMDGSNNNQRYQNIKTYSYTKTSPPRDLTIFDFETIRTPTTSNRIAEKCDLEASCSYCLKHIKQSEYYRKQYNFLRKQNALLRKKLGKFRKRNIQVMSSPLGELIKKQNVSEEAKTFLTILLRKSKYSGFSISQRELTQSLYFTSPACYRYMRECLNFSLPSRNSILKWMPIKNVFPGENKNLITEISKKVYLMSSEQKCAILLYDEMKIRSDLEYDKFNDIIHGYVDLGSRRESNIATHVLTFMVRGIFSKYKYPISYYTTENGISGNDLTKLITDNIEMARKMGFDIRVTICDQGSNNRKAYKSFGVTRDNPFYTIENKKVLAYQKNNLIHISRVITRL